MAFVQGERVNIDLDDRDNHDEVDATPPARPSALSLAFVADVTERAPPTETPAAPAPKPPPTGFPAHKKRVARTSAFKQQRAARRHGGDGGTAGDDASGAPPPKAAAAAAAAPRATPVGGALRVNGAGEQDDFEEMERRRIADENRQRIAEMSPEDIERERRELFAGLPASLVEKLLRRANISDGADGQEESLGGQLPPEPSSGTNGQGSSDKPVKEKKKVAFADEEPPVSLDRTETPSSSEADAGTASTRPAKRADEAMTNPDDNIPLDDSDPVVPAPSSIHFPRPPQPPPLDPSSPNFLADLHSKYFPSLPHDPSQLSWMAPLPTPDSPADLQSSYHPSQRAVAPAALRFGFGGELLAPRTARRVPAHLGLHHHADAPEAAGYTVAELARLARSAVPAQRCVAFQTLGRVLFRLGRGEFGREVDDAGEELGEGEPGKAMCRGLWEEVERERVIDTLVEEAGKSKGHLSARTYAQEALWNWRRGGGRKRKAV
ncbi:RPAP1-like protein [Lineolata rhizophorae]|uniref:RPAP1-like protein n=1 Tax=Lineolata rhizophorae TaxID=578093 RepID=A0A6A6P754_9PEZI|nr:RPAP1-like protein [Lineolata rhizophorae]